MVEISEGNLLYLEVKKGPKFVTAVQRIHCDISSLEILTIGMEPKRRSHRVHKNITEWYLLGDAKKSGFVTGL